MYVASTGIGEYVLSNSRYSIIYFTLNTSTTTTTTTSAAVYFMISRAVKNAVEQGISCILYRSSLAEKTKTRGNFVLKKQIKSITSDRSRRFLFWNVRIEGF